MHPYSSIWRAPYLYIALVLTTALDRAGPPDGALYLYGVAGRVSYIVQGRCPPIGIYRALQIDV